MEQPEMGTAFAAMDLSSSQHFGVHCQHDRRGLLPITLNRTTMAVFREFSNENPLRFLGFLWDFLPITLLTIGIIAVWMVLDHLPRVKVLHWQARKEALVSGSLLVVAAVLSMGCVRGTF